MINPKYEQSCEAGYKILLAQTENRDESFYNYYEESIVEKHKQLYPTIKKCYELSNWPKFSLKKIKLFPGETLTDLLLANAIVLAESDDKIEEYYYQLATKRISLASPFFNNLRKPGQKNLSSCFIMEVADSLDSIMKSVTHCANISKAGGGAGVNIGKLRAKGSSIGGNDNASSGIMGFVRLFDQVCVSVNQLGQRPGAITVALPIWHSDIAEFLDCQTENGDLRAKAYNIQPQVTIPDEFMQAVIDDEKYHLFCPKDLADNGIVPNTQEDWYIRAIKLGLTKRTTKARHLWKNIQEQQRTVGRPYLFFDSNAQKNSPFKNIGDIKSSNLCVESFSYFESDKYIHCCNLISINLAVHESFETIAESAMIATEMADISLDISHVDIDEVVNHVNDFRTIGVGLMGLADWLAYNNKYYSDTTFIEETAQVIALATYSASVLRASVVGACKRYSEMESDLWNKCDELLPEIAALRAKTGIRNSMMLATAPNTSTSLVMGSTASFLPPYQLEFYDESEDYTLNVICKYEEARYLTQFEINPLFITAATSAIQNWTDSGISMEYLLPGGASWSDNKEFSELKVDAWKTGVKTVYYIRNSESPSGGCTSCAN